MSMNAPNMCCTVWTRLARANRFDRKRNSDIARDGNAARHRFWIDELAMATTQAEKGVRRALADDQLVLFYQPIHELGSREIVSAEALLRARRSNGEIRSATKL